MQIITVKNLFIFSFFFIISSCNNLFNLSSQKVTIVGKIDPSLSNNNIIYFYQFTDSMSLFFCEKTATDSCELKPDGSFKLEISNWLKPGFFDLGTKEVVFARNFFLEPGDDITLNFKGKEMPVSLISYDNIGKYNQFLQIFNDTFYREPTTKRNYFVISNYMLAPDYAVFIGKRKNKQFDFYKNYFKNKEIDSTFNYYFEHETNYNWANDKIYFLWKKRIRMEEVPLDSSYFDFLNIVSNNDAKALICPGYTRFIDLYLKELYQEEIFSLPKGMPQNLEKCLLVKKHLQGIGKKIAYYNIIRDEIRSIDAHVEGNYKQHQIFVDSLAKIAFEATSDASFLQFAKSYKK
ncbi:MAG: hypothetical protein K9G64_07805 [Bacteroidia bacterium]|nr:hypothetical protein [Bacteroidia bacterium]